MSDISDGKFRQEFASLKASLTAHLSFRGSGKRIRVCDSASMTIKKGLCMHTDDFIFYRYWLVAFQKNRLLHNMQTISCFTPVHGLTQILCNGLMLACVTA